MSELSITASTPCNVLTTNNVPKAHDEGLSCGSLFRFLELRHSITDSKYPAFDNASLSNEPLTLLIWEDLADDGSERKEDGERTHRQTAPGESGKDGRMRVECGARADGMTGGSGDVVAGEKKIGICSGHLNTSDIELTFNIDRGSPRLLPPFSSAAAVIRVLHLADRSLRRPPRRLPSDWCRSRLERVLSICVSGCG